LIIVLACCAAIGFAAGFILRLPAFIAMCLLAVAVYAVFRAGREGAFELTYHLLLVGIALQIGYFAAIVTQVLFGILSGSKQVRSNNESRLDQGPDSHQQR
jgi:ABC-type Fe3+-siderophore transport system permease subunit